MERIATHTPSPGVDPEPRPDEPGASGGRADGWQ